MQSILYLIVSYEDFKSFAKFGCSRDAAVKELELTVNDSFIIDSINSNLSKAIFSW